VFACSSCVCDLLLEDELDEVERTDAGRTSAQCGRFPGIIPVFDLFLINFEWYWYWYLKVVFELFDCFSQLSL
jgi:hypothetical protein